MLVTPHEVDYNEMRDTLQRETSIMKFDAINGTNDGKGVVQIRLDNLPRAVLETSGSYLNFTYAGAVTAASVGFLGQINSSQAGAVACIEKVELISESNSVTVQEHVARINTMNDINSTSSSSAQNKTITEQGGNLYNRATYAITSAPAGVAIATTAAAVSGATTLVLASVAGIAVGYVVHETTIAPFTASGYEITNITGLTITFNTPLALAAPNPTTFTFYNFVNGGSIAVPQQRACVRLPNIMSCDEGIPVGMLKSHLTLQITFKSDPRDVYHNPLPNIAVKLSGGTMSYTNINYCCPVSVYDQTAWGVLSSNAKSNGNGAKCMFSGVESRATQHILSIAQLTSTATQIIRLSNNRFRSLRAMKHASFNPQVSGEYDINQCVISEDKWRIRIDGEQIPRNADVSNLNEMVALVSGISSPYDAGIIYNQLTATLTTKNARSVAASVSRENFLRGLCGINLQAFPDSESISGKDTSNSSSQLLLTFNGAAAATNLNLLCVSEYDVIYIIDDNGIMSSSH